MGRLNSPDIRKVGRTVSYNRADGRWIPAKVTIVGAGTSVTLKAADGATYTASKRVNDNDVNVWDNCSR